MTSPVAAYLFGLDLSGAVAPYLTVILKNIDPLLPFMLASLVLAVTTLAFRPHLNRPAPSLVRSAPTATQAAGFAIPLLVAVGLFAFGM